MTTYIGTYKHNNVPQTVFGRLVRWNGSSTQSERDQGQDRWLNILSEGGSPLISEIPAGIKNVLKEELNTVIYMPDPGIEFRTLEHLA